jgi:uncharacterized protein (DUF1697 family)
MALVVFLRGVNVGGYRAFRPSVLAKQLKHLGAVSIGAAGTFVFQQPISSTRLRAELAARVPFSTEIVICQGQDIVKLMSTEILAPSPTPAAIVRFVSVLSRTPRLKPALPLTLPARGKWMLKILACQTRFVIGQYRRHMKAIGYLGTLDRLFGVPATTRNWNTMAAIVKVLAISRKPAGLPTRLPSPGQC